MNRKEYRTSLKFAVIGIIVTPNKKEVLLVHKQHTPEKELGGKWIFPGGDLRFGEENFREALRKIIYHDLKLEVEVEEIIDSDVRVRKRAEHRQHIYTAWLEARVIGSTNVTPVKKHQAARWVLREELLNHIMHDDQVFDWIPPGVKFYFFKI